MVKYSPYPAQRPVYNRRPSKRQGPMDMVQHIAPVVAGVLADKIGNWFGGSTKDQTSGNTDQFFNIGERGTTNVSYKKKRARKPTKRVKIMRKKKRAFKKKVKRVLAPRVPLWTHHEFNQSTGIFTGGTLGLFTGLYNATSSNWYQLVLGNASTWGVNCGGLASTTQGLEKLHQEVLDYTVRINAADVSYAGADSRGEKSALWVKNSYLKLTLQNRNELKDLIFTLYECVAAQDISDPNYANPAFTWKYLYDNNASTGTDTIADWTAPFQKSVEPTEQPRFGRYWKIVKKTKCRIPYGIQDGVSFPYQTFKMYGNGKFMYKLKHQKLWAIKGKTKYFMMIIDPDRQAQRYTAAEQVMGWQCSRLHTAKPYSTFNNVFGPNALQSFLTPPTT